MRGVALYDMISDAQEKGEKFYQRENKRHAEITELPNMRTFQWDASITGAGGAYA